MEWVGTCMVCVDRGLLALGVSSLEISAAELGLTFVSVGGQLLSISYSAAVQFLVYH